jgi:hypothetical protein
MANLHARRSPSGRPIRIGGEPRQVPPWLARRRVAYRLIDAAATTTKRIVRRLVPRPARTVVQHDH